jgi:diguanylate cyclase (GGDEF)-like protein
MLIGLAPAVAAVSDLDLLLVVFIVLPVAAVHRAASESGRNEYLATHDDLTGLPNRVLFQQSVEKAIAGSRETQGTAAILLMDLDRFKEVHDPLGHHQGDALLREVAPRLKAVLREGDVAARLGGDEFAVLLSLPGGGGASALAAARRIIESFDAPIVLEQLTLDVDASIGIAIYPEHGDDVETLMRRADVAMYRAKDAHSGVEVYAPDDDHHTVRRLAMAGDIKRAMDNGDFVLHYQPKIDLRSGAVVGVEALLRWPHAERGMVPPSEFVHLAERTGLIRELTSFVVENAMRQCVAWQEQGIDVQVAMNLSARNLLDAGLADAVGRQLRLHELSAQRITFEITESVIMEEPDRAIAVLRDLSDMGIELAIDDFGMGYSSLSYLKHLPVDEIKIDRQFVTNMAADPKDAVIVRSIIELARNLGLRTVAEGVEDEITLGRLRRFGCDVAQGFHISRPQAVAQLTPWLVAHGCRRGEQPAGHHASSWS